MQNLSFSSVDCALCGSNDARQLYEIKSKVPFRIVKCRCGLLYMNPMIDANSIVKLYSEGYYLGESDHGFNFSNPLENLETTSFLYKERLEKIKNVTNIQKGRILDVGCTFGVFLYSIKDSGWELHGCDLSEYAVSMAKNKLGMGNIRVGTVGEAGYGDGYFDVVTLFEVIEHMRKPLEEIKSISNVLRSGGWLVVQTGNLGSFTARIRGKSNNYFQLGHINYFSKKTLRALLEKAGFEVVLIKTELEKIEPAKIRRGNATLRDYWRLFYYKIFERLGLSGSMTFYARKN